jgi:hypothetical protein
MELDFDDAPTLPGNKSKKATRAAKGEPGASLRPAEIDPSDRRGRSYKPAIALALAASAGLLALFALMMRTRLAVAPEMRRTQGPSPAVFQELQGVPPDDRESVTATAEALPAHLAPPPPAPTEKAAWEAAKRARRLGKASEIPSSAPSVSASAPESEPSASAAPSVSASAGPPREFDRASARNVMAQAAGSAQGCFDNETPNGIARVQVTFLPSGQSTEATIMGPPLAGTSVGACIAGRFNGLSVPPFDGDPVMVSATVRSPKHGDGGP